MRLNQILIGVGGFLIFSALPIWRDIYGNRNNLWQMLWGNFSGGVTCEHLTTEDAVARAKVARWKVLNVAFPI